MCSIRQGGAQRSEAEGALGRCGTSCANSISPTGSSSAASLPTQGPRHTPIDFDALPAVDVDVPAIYDNHQFSQELQLVADKGPLKGVFGFYYLRRTAADIFDVRLYTTCPTVPLPGCVVALPGLTAASSGDVHTKTWAIFGDFTYDFTPQWSVSLGGRYTNDKRQAKYRPAEPALFGGQPELGGSSAVRRGNSDGRTTSNFDGRRVDKAFTPRASIHFKPTPNNNIYAAIRRASKAADSTRAASRLRLHLNRPRTYSTSWRSIRKRSTAMNSGGKLACSTAVSNSPQPFSTPNIRTFRYRARPAVSSMVSRTFVGLPPTPARHGSAGSRLETNLRAAENLATRGPAEPVGDAGLSRRRSICSSSPTSRASARLDVADFRKIQNTPKWTLSGSLDYDTPAWGGRLDANTTVSYRSNSQQFEIHTPGLDQPGFALWDANIVWRSSGSRYEIGLHGKNLLNKKYVVAGYNFLAQNPFTGDFILNGAGDRSRRLAGLAC